MQLVSDNDSSDSDNDSRTNTEGVESCPISFPFSAVNELLFSG
jgi:hypothetical protein